MAEGYRVVGFDNERHAYGDARYPAQLVLQDVLTIHGRQFKDAALIVASPPCQEFSYMAMPWTRAKQIAAEYRDGTRDRATLTALFEACFRIQREANAAAGRFIPLVVENVCGAQKWVGRARWHFGSFYLWGDLPALMPIVRKHVKVPTMGAGWYPPGHPKHVPGLAFNGHADRNMRLETHRQISEGCRMKRYDETAKAQLAGDGVKFSQSGAAWFDGKPRDNMLGDLGPAAFGSKSSARKAASAHIAKIPLELARHIARAWKPDLREDRRAHD